METTQSATHDSSVSPSSGVSMRVITLVIGGALLILALATQYTAHLLGYQKSLGEPIFWRIYSPLNFLLWYLKFGHVVGTEKAFNGGCIIVSSTLALFIPAILYAAKRDRKYTNKTDIHGSAHWATKEETEKTGLFNKPAKGVYIGAYQETKRTRFFLKKNNTHYLTHDGPEHVLAFAPTRSGKGVGLVIPTLLSWRHSCLVYDIKGENWALTAGYRKAIGQHVLKFDPTASDGSSVKFNPLSEIRLKSPFEVKDVQNIAMMIVDPDGKGMDDHWAKTGYSLLVGAILHVLYSEQDKTLRGIARFLSDPERNLEQTMEIMLNTDHLGNVPHPVVAESARELLNKSENERSGVLSTTMSFLSLYRDPIVEGNTSTSEFKIHDLMNLDKPVSLYLVVPPSDKDRLKPLIRLIINQVVRQLTEKMQFADGRSIEGYKHRLLLMIDEFPSLGKLPIFQESLAFIAGYGLKAYLIIQDLSQLYAHYSKDEAIVSNCHIRIAYAPNKIETAELLSKMAGVGTVTQHQKSFSGDRRSPFMFNATASVQHVSRPLLTADEAMRLPPSDALVFVAGFSPILGKKILYYRDQTFSARSKIPSPSVSDRIHTDSPLPAQINPNAPTQAMPVANSTAAVVESVSLEAVSICESLAELPKSTPNHDEEATADEVPSYSPEEIELLDAEADVEFPDDNSDPDADEVLDFEV